MCAHEHFCAFPESITAKVIIVQLTLLHDLGRDGDWQWGLTLALTLWSLCGAWGCQSKVEPSWEWALPHRQQRQQPLKASASPSHSASVITPRRRRPCSPSAFKHRDVRSQEQYWCNSEWLQQPKETKFESYLFVSFDTRTCGLDKANEEHVWCRNS